MTDARLPERWLVDRRLLRLSDSAYRTFITALMWSVANRTDGQLDAEDIDLMHGARPADVAELVKSGLLRRNGAQLTVVDFAATQTSRDQLEVLENARRRDRDKKSRQRARGRNDPGDSPQGHPGGHVPRTAQDRQEGQEGQDRQLEEDPLDLDDDEVQGALAEYRGDTSWPEVCGPGLRRSVPGSPDD